MFLLDLSTSQSVQSSALDLLRNSGTPRVLLLLSHGGNRTANLWCALGQQVVTTVGKCTNEASRFDHCSKRARPKQQVGTAACNSSLRASCCPHRHGVPVPTKRRTQQQPCSEVLPLTKARCPEELCRAGLSTETSQSICAPGRVPRSSWRYSECFPDPHSSSTGVLDVKQAAACHRVWFQSSTETKMTLHFRPNPTSLQNTSWFGVQMWGLLCLKKGPLYCFNHTPNKTPNKQCIPFKAFSVMSIKNYYEE